MLINPEKMKEVSIQGFNGGEGSVTAKMFMDGNGKIIFSKVLPGSSIGMHSHITSSDINFVISGHGKAMCDGSEEELSPGVCHYCPKGSSHSIVNTGSDDLVLLTVVPEQ